MAKKKKTVTAKVEPIVLTNDELAQARAYLEGLKGDVSYSQAKRQIAQACGWERAKGNAAVVALHQEGFMAGDKNWFCHPDAAQEPGVVRGARELANFTVMLQSDPDVSMPVPFTLKCLPGDVFMMRRQATGDWHLSNFVARHQTRWVCRLLNPTRRRRHTGVVEVIPVNTFAPVVMMMDLADVPENVDLSKAAFEVELLPESQKPEPYVDVFAKFVKEIGNRFDPLGEIAIASAEYDLPVEFSDATLEEAAALPDEVDRRTMGRRVDLRDIPFVTIDGEDARDFDDAVWCMPLDDNKTRLLVAIADVSHYVKPGSALDVDAQKRATSVYFPSSVVPMLPEKLSNGLCSLNPGVDRLTMVCDAVLNAEGQTEAYQFYPAVIHSHARLTYTQVWGALQGEEGGLAAVGERLDDIKHLYALFKVLRAARNARHTLDLETQETMAVFDDKGMICDFKVRDHNDAHRLIEECMLVANVCAADFVIQKKRDSLFRVHDEPSPDRLETLRTVLKSFNEKLTEATPQGFAELIERTKENEFLQTAILRSMSRACYDPVNIGHYGLQYKAYAHFTSPIRRYPDLLLHRTIKGILSRRVYVPQVVFDDSSVMVSRQARGLGSRPETKSPTEGETRNESRRRVWERLGILCSAAERRADDATRDVMNYLKCDYMIRHGKGRHEAIVTGMIAAGVFVSLKDTAIEGFIHISNLGWGYYEFDEKALTMTSREEMAQVRVGDRVIVRLEDVDLENRRMSFVLDTNLERHVIKGVKKGGRSSGRRGSRQGWRPYRDDDFLDHDFLTSTWEDDDDGDDLDEDWF